MKILFILFLLFCYILGFFIILGILTFLTTRGLIFENYKNHYHDDSWNFWISCIFWPFAIIIFAIIGLIFIAKRLVFKYQNLVINLSEKKESKIDDVKSDYRNIVVK